MSGIIYYIRVEGQLDPTWSAWFEGLSIVHEGNGDTVLRGPIADQAHLFGVLMKVHNLNLALISVNRSESEIETRS